MKKLKKGDKVIIIYGNHKGKSGVIKKILSKKNKSIIDGINIIKKHIKPGIKNPKGKILEKEAPIHMSNLKKIK
ncbi:50S ribosomal protein L24 [Blattabacterium cuenoti]|uniref:50S ribosomal protein L24 n=1 Tax=Blattabacterium cuenoti TaxID=1653831 RepID=UPI00163CD6CF|nr:50S ribosomal protein L24 [Blattabacterium cuenoti]